MIQSSKRHHGLSYSLQVVSSRHLARNCIPQCKLGHDVLRIIIHRGLRLFRRSLHNGKCGLCEAHALACMHACTHVLARKQAESCTRCHASPLPFPLAFVNFQACMEKNALVGILSHPSHARFPFQPFSLSPNLWLTKNKPCQG